VVVIVPTLSWQGANPEDDDRDGFPDTLDTARSVAAERPYLGTGLPREMRSVAAPLTRFLDRERLPYAITTDAALAAGRGPRLENAAGIAVAGSARWLPRPLLRRLRRVVERGGAIASFGADSYRRSLRVAGGRLVRDGGTAARDVFGEATERFTTVPSPLRTESDTLGLFRGVDTLFGEFTRFEVSRALGRGARSAAGAGRDPGEPAFVAYRLGRGIVVRAGSLDWARNLTESRLDVAVPRVTTRIWRSVLGG
jgi:hypothetical protein